MNDFMRQIDFYKINKSAFYQRIYQEKCNIIKINTLLELRSSYELNPTETLESSEIQTHIIQMHALLHHTDSQVHHLSRQK